MANVNSTPLAATYKNPTRSKDLPGLMPMSRTGAYLMTFVVLPPWRMM